MSNIPVFIQSHGQANLVEVSVPQAATAGDLLAAIASIGVKVDAGDSVFIDDGEAPLEAARNLAVKGLKPGGRIHISRCKRIKTTVHFLDKTAERAFPPGTRVRAVKEWAVREFHMSPKDAAEHVLQLCNSVERPKSDTPLNQLGGRDCAVCFDLVPEKRIEG
jgi:hypothetical protein